MKRNFSRKLLSLILSAALMLNSGATAFATDGGADGADGAPIVTASETVTTPDEAPPADEPKAEVPPADETKTEDPPVDNTTTDETTPPTDEPKAETPPAEDVVTESDKQEGANGAGSAIGTSSVGGETGKPETPPAPDKTDCTCPPVDSGEVVHSADCPLYVAPEAPSVSDAVKAVEAQIQALAAAADAGEAPDADAVKAARAAYDALTDEEKAAFDADTLALLVMLEGALAAVPMAGEAITIEVSDGTTTKTGGGDTLAKAVTASGVTANTITALKITAGEVTAEDWNYFTGGTPGNTKTRFTALKTFEVADAVTSVADIPNGTGYYPIFHQTITHVTIPQVIVVGNEAFSSCINLTTVSLPKVTTVGEHAFYNCNSLSEVDSLSNAITIGRNAFYNCTSLDNVSFPVATSIGKTAFFGCAALTNANLPKATSIGEDAFSGCKKLATVTLPAATSVGINAFFECTALATVTLPAATSVGINAFYGCTALATVTLPAATSIGENAFYDCAALATLKLGAGVPTVTKANAFTNCPSPRNLTLVDADGNELTDPTALATAIAAYKAAPDGNATDNLWWGWTLPTAPELPKITITVNGGAAVGGASLSDAVTKSGVTANTITALKITAGKVTADDWKYFAGGTPGTTTSPFTALETFEVAGAVTTVADIPNGALQAPIFPATITSVTIPQVIEVGAHAFYNRKVLATVNLPKATTIGESAFAECALLTTMNLPKATTIGDAAFRFCSKLITMNLPKATAIGKRVFYNCSTLSELKLGITVPTVGHSAFDGCPSPRSVVFVDADSNPLTELTDPKLSVVAANYDKAIDFIEGSTATDGLWQGWKVREPVADPVASWAVTGGGTGQGTLPEALAAVKASGGTVTLLDNVDDRMNAIDVTISEFSQPVTLVLNGKTLHANVIFEKVTGLFTVDGTAEGSKIQGATGAAIYSDGRNFELKGGTYIGAFDESGNTSEEAPAIAMWVPSPKSEEVGKLYTLLAEGYAFANKTGFGIIPEGSDNGIAFTGNQVEITVAREASWISADGNTTATGTLKAALNLAKKSGGTVTLLTDAEVRDENTGYISTLMIDSAFEKAVTLVLNGHTLTGDIGLMGNTGLFTIDGSKDGSTVKSPYSSGITGLSGAQLKLKGGTYTCSKIESMEPYAIMLIGATSVDALNDLLADGYMFESEEGFGVLAEDGDSAAITGQTVKVVPTAAVAVTDVTLDKTALSLQAGKSETLTATVAPENATNKAVAWKTSNPAIATVDANGTVTAVAVGSATITVTTTDGGKTATCAVTVTAATSKPAPGGKLEAPLTQDKVDDIFGEGNATLDGTTTPPTIKLEKDITPEKPIEIETDVKIDLGGNTITGKPGETPIIVGGSDKVTIDGSGTIAGGDSTTGTGGNGITGGTGSEIIIGKDVIVSGGDGTTGGDGINSGGTVTDNGKTEGGNGSAGNGGDGVDTSGGSGNIVIGGGGTASGGDSTGGNGNGGNGTSSGGNTTVGGDVTGGNGNGSGSGGNGATDTAGGNGDIIINGGGSAQGGNGGNSGGAGGDGAQNNGGGNTTVGGDANGGNGGSNSSGTGGNGGDGSTSTDSGGSIITGGGSSTGGNGGSGATGGKGGDGADSGTIDIENGGTANGGNGGTGTGTGGNGGDGSNSSGKGDIDGSANGGNGGAGGSTGGAGGNGAASGSGGNAGDIDISGKTEGGNGGTGGTSGGAGGNGTATGGDINVAGGGSSTGGNGGSSSTGGGNGGNGTNTSGGGTVINGGATGGNGGNGNGNGSGGNGGNGASQGGGTVNGGGTATGGNGGNGAGTGNGGTGGAGVGGGATAGGDLNVKNGISAKVEVVGDAGVKVELPNAKETVDAVLTNEEKADKNITDVKVTLKVDDKTAAKPDKAAIDAAKPTGSIIGAFFDITLKKTITKTGGSPITTDVTGTPNNQMITITIEIPANMQGGSDYVVIRVHNGTGTALSTTQLGNDLTFDTNQFSTYAIAYTKSTTPPLPSDNTGGGGSSSSNDEYDFWMSVKDKINSANSGDVIKVSAKSNDKMPESVMAALRKNSGVTLVISWNGGKTITIPAGKAAKQESGRIYWPLSLLAELYQGIEFVEKPADISKFNPETGGGDYIAYADGKQIPVTGGVAQMEAPAIDSAPDTAMPGAPETITPPTAGFEADTFAGTPDAKAARGMGTAAIAGFAMLLAALCGGGVWFWKRRTQTEKQ